MQHSALFLVVVVLAVSPPTTTAAVFQLIPVLRWRIHGQQHLRSQPPPPGRDPPCRDRLLPEPPGVPWPRVLVLAQPVASQLALLSSPGRQLLDHPALPASLMPSGRRRERALTARGWSSSLATALSVSPIFLDLSPLVSFFFFVPQVKFRFTASTDFCRVFVSCTSFK
jgi:hypothetical protein